MRVEGDHVLVKEKDGKEVRMHIDQTTKMSDKKLAQGELIEATLNEENHALSIHSPDRRSNHTLESGQSIELKSWPEMRRDTSTIIIDLVDSLLIA